jgi:hypothetical protein
MEKYGNMAAKSDIGHLIRYQRNSAELKVSYFIIGLNPILSFTSILTLYNGAIRYPKYIKI